MQVPQGTPMDRYLHAIDNVSTWTGKAFAWAIVMLTAIVCYDVFARYLFRAPTDWAFDASYILYGALFMMAGAYTLARNGHVRGTSCTASSRPGCRRDST